MGTEIELRRRTMLRRVMVWMRWGIRPHDIPAGRPERPYGKDLVFGVNYGQKPDSFGDHLKGRLDQFIGDVSELYGTEKNEREEVEFSRGIEGDDVDVVSRVLAEARKRLDHVARSLFDTVQLAVSRAANRARTIRDSFDWGTLNAKVRMAVFRALRKRKPKALPRTTKSSDNGDGGASR